MKINSTGFPKNGLKGKILMAQLRRTSYELPPYKYTSGVPFSQTEHARALDRLQEISDNLPDGEIVGAVISFPVADGKAFYRVVKEKPLTLQHINYLDGYGVPIYLIRGLRKKDILELLRRKRALDKLFG